MAKNIDKLKNVDDKKKLILRLYPEFIRQVKIGAATESSQINEYVERAIRFYMERNKKTGG